MTNNNANRFDSESNYLQSNLSKDEIRSQLANRLESALFYLYPNGVSKYGKFHIGDVDGVKGRSLKIELKGPKAGLWHDFATGEGSDIFGLWAKARGFDDKNNFPRLMEEIKNWLGVYTPFQTPIKSINSPANKNATNDNLSKPSAEWSYTDLHGNVIAKKLRYDVNGKKSYLPWDEELKKYKMPKSRPLYNLPGITKSNKVILVEGEKCAQALIDKGICATTAMGGANTDIKKTEWESLKGKDVIIWPDNDVPGKEYAEKIANFLKTKSVKSLAILNISADKPEKWDAADAIQDGLNIEAFLEQAAKTEYSRKRTPFLKVKVFRDDKSPIAEDIISPRILTPNGFMVFGGAPKVGKSDFLLSWMAHMAAGISFLDMTPARPLKICFLQTEVDYDYLRERINTIILDESLWGLVEENLSLTPKVDILLNEQGVEELIEDIKDHFQSDKVDIIVVDPLYDVFDNKGSDLGENDNTLMNFFLKNRIEYLCDQINPKAGIIVAHHLRKTTKAAFEEDPFSALAGASCIRRRFTSGLILYCPDESQTLRKLIFEIRNGKKILPKWVDKIDGKWQELENGSIRLANQKLGQKQDAELDRQNKEILKLIRAEALDGIAYTINQFCEKFEGYEGLGRNRSIRNRVYALATHGYIKFFKNPETYNLPILGKESSKFGYLCIENMLLKTKKGNVLAIPTDYKRPIDGRVVEVQNPTIWEYSSAKIKKEGNYGA